MDMEIFESEKDNGTDGLLMTAEKTKKLREAHERYREELSAVYANGEVTQDERNRLNSLRVELGLSFAEASREEAPFEVSVEIADDDERKVEPFDALCAAHCCGCFLDPHHSDFPDIDWNTIDHTMRKWVEFGDTYLEYVTDYSIVPGAYHYLCIDRSIDDLFDEYGEKHIADAVRDGRIVAFENYDELLDYMCTRFNLMDVTKVQERYLEPLSGRGLSDCLDGMRRGGYPLRRYGEEDLSVLVNELEEVDDTNIVIKVLRTPCMADRNAVLYSCDIDDSLGHDLYKPMSPYDFARHLRHVGEEDFLMGFYTETSLRMERSLFYEIDVHEYGRNVKEHELLEFMRKGGVNGFSESNAVMCLQMFSDRGTPLVHTYTSRDVPEVLVSIRRNNGIDDFYEPLKPVDILREFRDAVKVERDSAAREGEGDSYFENLYDSLSFMYGQLHGGEAEKAREVTTEELRSFVNRYGVSGFSENNAGMCIQLFRDRETPLMLVPGGDGQTLMTVDVDGERTFLSASDVVERFRDEVSKLIERDGGDDFFVSLRDSLSETRLLLRQAESGIDGCVDFMNIKGIRYLPNLDKQGDFGTIVYKGEAISEKFVYDSLYPLFKVSEFNVEGYSADAFGKYLDAHKDDLLALLDMRLALRKDSFFGLRDVRVIEGGENGAELEFGKFRVSRDSVMDALEERFHEGIGEDDGAFVDAFYYAIEGVDESEHGEIEDDIFRAFVVHNRDFVYDVINNEIGVDIKRGMVELDMKYEGVSADMLRDFMNVRGVDGFGADMAKDCVDVFAGDKLPLYRDSDGNFYTRETLDGDVTGTESDMRRVSQEDIVRYYMGAVDHRIRNIESSPNPNFDRTGIDGLRSLSESLREMGDTYSRFSVPVNPENLKDVLAKKGLDAGFSLKTLEYMSRVLNDGGRKAFIVGSDSPRVQVIGGDVMFGDVVQSEPMSLERAVDMATDYAVSFGDTWETGVDIDYVLKDLGSIGGYLRNFEDSRVLYEGGAFNGDKAQKERDLQDFVDFFNSHRSNLQKILPRKADGKLSMLNEMDVDTARDIFDVFWDSGISVRANFEKGAFCLVYPEDDVNYEIYKSVDIMSVIDVALDRMNEWNRDSSTMRENAAFNRVHSLVSDGGLLPVDVTYYIKVPPTVAQSQSLVNGIDDAIMNFFKESSELISVRNTRGEDGGLAHIVTARHLFAVTADTNYKNISFDEISSVVRAGVSEWLSSEFSGILRDGERFAVLSASPSVPERNFYDSFGHEVVLSRENFNFYQRDDREFLADEEGRGERGYGTDVVNALDRFHEEQDRFQEVLEKNPLVMDWLVSAHIASRAASRETRFGTAVQDASLAITGHVLRENPSISEEERGLVKEVATVLTDAVLNDSRITVRGHSRDFTEDSGYLRDFVVSSLFNDGLNGKVFPLTRHDDAVKIVDDFMKAAEEQLPLSNYPSVEEHFYICPNTDTSITMTDIPEWSIPFMRYSISRLQEMGDKDYDRIAEWKAQNHISSPSEVSYHRYFSDTPVFGEPCTCCDANFTLEKPMGMGRAYSHSLPDEKDEVKKAVVVGEYVAKIKELLPPEHDDFTTVYGIKKVLVATAVALQSFDKEKQNVIRNTFFDPSIKNEKDLVKFLMKKVGDGERKGPEKKRERDKGIEPRSR